MTTLKDLTSEDVEKEYYGTLNGQPNIKFTFKGRDKGVIIIEQFNSNTGKTFTRKLNVQNLPNTPIESVEEFEKRRDEEVRIQEDDERRIQEDEERRIQKRRIEDDERRIQKRKIEDGEGRIQKRRIEDGRRFRIQPDFSIKLNDVQLLKKFHNQDNEKFQELFPQICRMFDEKIFIINVTEDSISVAPYFDESHNTYFRSKYTSPQYENLKKFLKFQLINSGVISTLRNIEIKTYDGKLLMGNPRRKQDITVQNRFVLYLTGVTSSIRHNSFHNDSALFNILTYYKPDGPVLGSNILFYDQRKAPLHAYMSKSTGEYNVDDIGILISETQKEINDMYDKDDIESVLLRGLYNSGDTLVLNDMLLKHSVVSPQEIYDRDKNIMTISVATSKTRDGVTSIDEKIRVCPQQILPSKEDLNNRGLVRCAIVNVIPLIDSESKLLTAIYGYGDESTYIRTEFGFIITREEEIPMAIPEMNFDIKEYARFLKTLNHVESYGTCGEFSFVPSGHLAPNVFIVTGGVKMTKHNRKKRTKSATIAGKSKRKRKSMSKRL